MFTTPLWGKETKFAVKVDQLVMTGRNAKKPNITGFRSNISHEGKELTEMGIFNISVSVSHPRVQLVFVNYSLSPF